MGIIKCQFFFTNSCLREQIAPKIIPNNNLVELLTENFSFTITITVWSALLFFVVRVYGFSEIGLRSNL